MDITIDDIAFSRLLVKRYTSYDLDEMDCMVLLVSDAVLSVEKTLLTCDILASYMKAPREKIDGALSRLLSMKAIEIVEGKDGVYSSLESFKRKVFEDWMHDVALKGKSAARNVASGNLYTELEQLCGHMLSPIERDMVTKWLQEGADEEMVKEACQRSITKGGDISFKRADKILLELERSEGRKKIGVSTVDEDTRKKEEIRDFILNTDWTYHDKEGE